MLKVDSSINIKSSDYLFIIVFFIFVSIQIFISFYFIDKEYKERVSFLQTKGILKLNNQMRIINHRLSAMKSYTNIISNDLSNIKQYNEKKLSDTFKTHIIKEFGMFQLRLLSNKGMELIRYDIDDNNKIIEIKKLQDKSNRYYYKDAKYLQVNEFLFSELDLNEENGKIETPYKSTIRIIKKLKIEGNIYYLVANYNLSQVLSDFFSTTLYDIFLIEKDNQINFHLDHNYSFSKQKENGVYLKDLIVYDNQYILKKKLTNFPYYAVVMIKKSQLDFILTSKSKSEQTALIVPLLLTMVLYIAFNLVHRIQMTKELKIINNSLKETIKHEIGKNIEKDLLLLEKAKMAAMGEMIQNIAHQWRQPLMEVNALYLEVEAKITFYKTISNDEILEAIKKSNKIISFMSNTIDNFMNFFKQDNTKKLVNVNEIIQQTLDIVSLTLKFNNISINTDLQAKSSILSNQTKLSQIILSIIQNSQEILVIRNIKAAIINIKTYETPEFSIIEIEDNAGGITTEPIEKIFEPLFTREKQNGTGLGLYIAKLIINKHLNGNLSVENSSIGAKFILKLPKII